MANYDEDLFENPFFLVVHKQFTGLFNQAVAEKALVCVPKYATCQRKSITQTDVEDHILIPSDADDDESKVYKTVSGKTVVITDGKLKTTKGFEIQQSVRILFEETFHSENDNGYRVLCMDHFLNRPPEAAQASNDSSSKEHSLTSYEQCLDVLWSHAGGQRTRDNLDKLMNAFADVYDTLEGENLRSLVDMGSAHFTKAMQLLLRDTVVRRSVKHNPAYMESLKVAVETYLMNAVHLRLFRVLTAVMASEDAEINKMTRNLTAIQIQDLGIRKIFSQNIPPAKKELAGLNRFSTPLGRLFCVKRVVTALTRPLKQHSGKTDDSTAMMTTDDFLPILIFLIVKSEIPNWMANLVYMRHFHFAKSSDDDEFGFYLASVEAALEHIKSGYITEDLKINTPQRDRSWTLLDFSPTHAHSEGTAEGTGYQRQMSVIDIFFKSVQEGNEAEVQRMLRQPQRSSEEVYLKLCHPLCSCDRCDKVLASIRNNSNLVTAYTRDNRGYTALHMAAYYGQGVLIDVLIKSGAVVDATDYLGLTPLHLASQRGYQNVMLLLLHFSGDIMARDNEGNTPLHHCCLNGHDDCVKALVFYDAAVRKLEINTCNELGDTALHMAAKWGYENIVKTMLENGANAMIKNRKRQSPVHVAQNVKVQRLLQHSVEGLELQPVSSFTTSGVRKNSSCTLSTTSADYLKQGTLTQTLTESLTVTSGMDDVASGLVVETASLDEAQDRRLKKKKEKLFKAIVDGDIQLVKFYLGLDDELSSPMSDDEEVTPAAGKSHDMCHPLCQCSKCLSIQKAQVKAHQSLGVNVKTMAGYTPLHMSVLHSHDDLSRLFLQHGAQLNTQNHKNLTPLHIAVCLKKPQVMHMLLERGARLNIRDINGDAPLLICSASGFMEGVQALIQKGADVNVTNYRGNTALHEAADHANLGIIRILLDCGADPTIRNKQTKSAANMARDTQTEKLLQSAAADWQKKRAEQRPRGSSQRVVANTHVSVQELFAAFEAEDLRTLKNLTSSIRKFHEEGSLRKTITRDNSKSFLDSLTLVHFIESFDQSSLRHVKPRDKSRPLYIYSLASGESCDGDEQKPEGDKEIGATSDADVSRDSTDSDREMASMSRYEDDILSRDENLRKSEVDIFQEEESFDLKCSEMTPQEEELFSSHDESWVESANRTPLTFQWHSSGAGKLHPGDTYMQEHLEQCDKAVNTEQHSHCVDAHQLARKTTNSQGHIGKDTVSMKSCNDSNARTVQSDLDNERVSSSTKKHIRFTGKLLSVSSVEFFGPESDETESSSDDGELTSEVLLVSTVVNPFVHEATGTVNSTGDCMHEGVSAERMSSPLHSGDLPESPSSLKETSDALSLPTDHLSVEETSQVGRSDGRETTTASSTDVKEMGLPLPDARETTTAAVIENGETELPNPNPLALFDSTCSTAESSVFQNEETVVDHNDSRVVPDEGSAETDVTCRSADWAGHFAEETPDLSAEDSCESFKSVAETAHCD